MNKKVLITGIAGQDGSYLAEFLLSKNYEVYGVGENLNDKKNLWRVKHILDKLILRQGDISNYKTIKELIFKIKPNEIYHLATKHDLPNSLENYMAIRETNLDSVYFMLSAIKEFSSIPKIFLASSSRIFGDAKTFPQNEETPFHPNTPYGIAKTAGFHFVKMYREAYKIFACTGILYNHESPRRDFNFLPRKITQVAAKIKFGKEDKLVLGNIEAKCDWGFAGDYVEAMWLMLQAEKPDDYIIGTGEIHSVKDILNIAFGEVGLNWENYVVINREFFRKEGDVPMVADISKIKNKLGWQPKIKFEELIKMMIKEDIRLNDGKKL